MMKQDKKRRTDKKGVSREEGIERLCYSRHCMRLIFDHILKTPKKPWKKMLDSDKDEIVASIILLTSISSL